ncbi:kinase domain protein [Aspergillus novoparasiticus]|uniref:Kinase domain protein n=1 Tax=Aspergillus novoparasiticus TaxID=986946 RepID=A0A5N6F389_9EURO|nr:kinase domain protein [Aspergillus novoparasiticus]
MINYKSLPLLDDTVTEVLLEQLTGISGTLDMNNSAEGTSNRIVNLAGNLRYCNREDPERVFYPIWNEFPSFHQIDASEITEEAEIKDGIFHVSNYQRPYILKVVNRPRDTDVIRKELESLACFHNVPNIVHTAGVAVSDNPYKTSKTSNAPPVVIGILLEAHSGGSLEQAFAERRNGMYPWRQWPIQIGSALSHVHEAGWTHMDIKPSNVVRNAEGISILIDTSGIGGITHAWRAPESREETSTLELPLKARRLNDAWAYGKLLSEPASQIGEIYSVWLLEWIADGSMREDPETRMSLSGAVRRLKAIDQLARCII